MPMHGMRKTRGRRCGRGRERVRRCIGVCAASSKPRGQRGQARNWEHAGAGASRRWDVWLPHQPPLASCTCMDAAVDAVVNTRLRRGSALYRM